MRLQREQSATILEESSTGLRSTGPSPKRVHLEQFQPGVLSHDPRKSP
jgi:hypothetical protein